MVPGTDNVSRAPVLYGRGGPASPGNPANGGGLFQRPPIFGYDLIVNTIAAEWTGGQLNTAFPGALRIKQGLPFDVDIGLVGMVLVCSLINTVADTRFGVWAAIDVGESINLDGANRCFIGAVTQQNSQAGGVPNPSSKTASLSFGENSAVRVNSNQRISLYASGNNVDQIGAATLTIFTIQLYRGQNG
jgi:hypothetical protein